MGTVRPIKKGDLVIMVSASFFDEWVGAIATVTEGYSMRLNSIDMHTLERVSFMGYEVRLGDGRIVNAEPYQVRLLPPLDQGKVTDIGLLKTDHKMFTRGTQIISPLRTKSSTKRSKNITSGEASEQYPDPMHSLAESMERHLTDHLTKLHHKLRPSTIPASDSMKTVVDAVDQSSEVPSRQRICLTPFLAQRLKSRGFSEDDLSALQPPKDSPATTTDTESTQGQFLKNTEHKEE